MQLGLIVGIAFAILAVLFALQNIASVTVTLGFWSFEGSLALVLLVTLGLGALIAGLVSSPAMIRRQWSGARLGRKVADLERQLVEEQRRNDELRAALAPAGTGYPPAEIGSGGEPGTTQAGGRVLIAGGGNERKPAP